MYIVERVLIELSTCLCVYLIIYFIIKFMITSIIFRIKYNFNLLLFLKLKLTTF